MAHRTGAKGNRAKNYRRVCALRQREPTLNKREIGYRLGLSRSYVSALLADPTGAEDMARRDRYRTPCAGGCGTLLDGSYGHRGAPQRTGFCRPCLAAERKYWTREVVIEAIREWARRRGFAPIADDWIVQVTDPDGYRFPPRTSVYVSQNGASSPFETWADAIEAAGFPRPQGDRNYVDRDRWRVENMGEVKTTREYVVFEVVEHDGGEVYEFVGIYEAATTKEALEENVKTYGKFRISAVSALVEYELFARPVATRTTPRTS